MPNINDPSEWELIKRIYKIGRYANLEESEPSEAYERDTARIKNNINQAK